MSGMVYQRLASEKHIQASLIKLYLESGRARAMRLFLKLKENDLYVKISNNISRATLFYLCFCYQTAAVSTDTINHNSYYSIKYSVVCVRVVLFYFIYRKFLRYIIFINFSIYLL